MTSLRRGRTIPGVNEVEMLGRWVVHHTIVQVAVAAALAASALRTLWQVHKLSDQAEQAAEVESPAQTRPGHRKGPMMPRKSSKGRRSTRGAGRAVSNGHAGVVTSAVKALSRYSPDAQEILLDRIKDGLAAMQIGAGTAPAKRKRRTKAEMEAARAAENTDTEKSPPPQEAAAPPVMNKWKGGSKKSKAKKSKAKSKAKSRRPSIASAPAQVEPPAAEPGEDGGGAGAEG